MEIVWNPFLSNIQLLEQNDKPQYYPLLTKTVPLNGTLATRGSAKPTACWLLLGYFARNSLIIHNSGITRSPTSRVPNFWDRKGSTTSLFLALTLTPRRPLSLILIVNPSYESQGVHNCEVNRDSWFLWTRRRVVKAPLMDTRRGWKQSPICQRTVSHYTKNTHMIMNTEFWHPYFFIYVDLQQRGFVKVKGNILVYGCTKNAIIVEASQGLSETVARAALGIQTLRIGNVFTRVGFSWSFVK